MSCDECYEAWDGQQPPCHECTKADLLPTNANAWAHWMTLNEFDRQYGAMGGVYKLSTQVIANICNFYGENLETFEKIIKIERQMYPTIVTELDKKVKSK